jgi:K+/H+ antiporter YhaU regulatory subunit KhtT
LGSSTRKTDGNRRLEGEESFRLNPRSHEVLDDGDLIIVLGTGEQVDKLQAIAK